ncbi:MAG: hypothetical protein CMI00_11075 [Oceanospirillaceae bacterium]|nr:hypothetical protein [Oceanospirillaceae bacterium]|tara:strand:- start:1883 stop:2398 length:516 start_codon:yes stop_codon:yes gene_type:complete
MIKEDEIEKLRENDFPKYLELSTLVRFINSNNLNFEKIEPSEQPDFILTSGSKTIGVELTEATRESLNRFPHHQIESAQNEFAENLRVKLHPNISCEVHIAFEDGIAVNRKTLEKHTDKIKNIIKENICKYNQGFIICRNKDDYNFKPNLIDTTYRTSSRAFNYTQKNQKN